ncbi:hypothetical protein BC828DRAFT_383912, partial [Blastocladiella britannica]
MLVLPSTPGFNTCTDAFLLPPSFPMHTPPPPLPSTKSESIAAWPVPVRATPIQWHYAYPQQQWTGSPSPALPPPSTMTQQRTMLPLMGMDLGDAARLGAGPLAAGSTLTLWPQIIEASPAPSLLMMTPPPVLSMPSSCSPPPPLNQGNRKMTRRKLASPHPATTRDLDDITKRAEVAQRARRMRQRTTAYINELEDTCIALKHECDQIRAEIALLSSRQSPVPPPPPCSGCADHAATVHVRGETSI